MSLPQPLGGRVLVRPAAQPETSDAGLALVRDYDDPDVMGEIVAVGRVAPYICPHCRGRSNHVPAVNVGATVLFPPTSGQSVTLDGERFVILPARDLLAVLEDDV